MGTQTNRLPSGGRIDRGTEITFTVDGVEHTGHPGDTIASALIANGRVRVGDSIYRGRPRGILAAGGEEPNALVQILGEHSEPSVTATVRSLTDGLKAKTLSGLGVLDPEPDTAAYDKRFVHTDVLVIGAGPSGLAAALSAARSGARVILLDEQAELGGSLLASRTELVDGTPAIEWVAQAAATLAEAEEVTVLTRTAAFGSYDDNYVLAVEDRAGSSSAPQPDGFSRQRVWHIRAAQVILANGAYERPLVFAGNDVPGVMLAGAVRTYLNRYAVTPGRRFVVATTNDSAYDVVEDIVAAGLEVVAVLDARATLSARATEVAASGVRVLRRDDRRAGRGRQRDGAPDARPRRDDRRRRHRHAARDLRRRRARGLGWLEPAGAPAHPAPGHDPLGCRARRLRAGRHGQGPVGRRLRPRHRGPRRGAP